jgi:hypothetical protein
VSAHTATFHYALHALLRKRGLDLEALQGELAAARAEVEHRRQSLERRRAALAELESLQRQQCQDGQIIDVDARLRLHHCQSTARAQVNEHTRSLAQAQAHWESALDRVSAGRQAVRALEQHRSASKAQFEAVGVRKELAAADELYLANQPRPAHRNGRASQPRRP